MWDEPLARLPVEVVAGRLPGHGLAPWRPAVASFDGVVDALVDGLPVGPPPWLVAYSMGARVALAMLVRDPSRFAGAVLVGVHPGLDDDVDRRARAAVDDERVERLVRDGLDAFVAGWEAEPLFASQRALAPAALERQRTVRRSHDARAVADALATLGLGRMPPLGSALARCGTPALLLTGALDEKFERIAAALASTRPGLEHRRVIGAGHNAALEQPAAVAALIAGRLGVELARAPVARSRDGS